MVWIKFDHSTGDKPEIFQMAEILNIDPDAVIGKLCRIWVWADAQTVDGNAPSVTRALLDRLANHVGFMDAMEKVGWLTRTEDGIHFTNFDRHNGNSAKNRALTALRVEKYRAGADGVAPKVKRSCNAECNAPSVTKTLPEKRREDEIRDKETPTPFLESSEETQDNAAIHYGTPERLPVDTSKPIPFGLPVEAIESADMLRVEETFLGEWNSREGLLNAGASLSSINSRLFRTLCMTPGWLATAERAMAKFPTPWHKANAPQKLTVTKFLEDDQLAAAIADGGKYSTDGQNAKPSKPVDNSKGVIESSMKATRELDAANKARKAREATYRKRLAERWGADAGLLTDKQITALDQQFPDMGLYSLYLESKKKTCRESMRSLFVSMLYECMEMQAGGKSFRETEAGQ